jgi:hypothetical protein
LNDPFFDVVTYCGAFGANDWTQGWANYDCQNTIYTGIKEINPVSSLSVYPNPAAATCIVRFHLSASSDVKFTIYDLQGRLASETASEKMSPGSISRSLDLSPLNPGFYTIVVHTDSGQSAYKITKQ